MTPTATEWAELTKAARDASLRAYCPYSRFPVGAALLAQDGKIYAGCNVENASYGLTMCAERNAVFHAVASGMTSIRAMVLFTPTDHPTTPCGACRQVLNEFGPNALVRAVCNGTETIELTVAELLPQAFGPGNL